MSASDGKDSLSDGDEAGGVAVVLGAAERGPRVRVHVVDGGLAPVVMNNNGIRLKRNLTVLTVSMGLMLPSDIEKDLVLT